MKTRLALAALLALAGPAFAADNPLLVDSDLPFHYPRFDRLKVEHFQPAVEQAMAERRKAIDAIAADPSPPTFENTVVALERAGTHYDRVQAIFSNMNSAHTTPGLQAVQEALAPRIAAHVDEVLLDAKLYARVDAVWAQREQLHLDAEDTRLLWRWHQDMERAGARLPEAGRATLKDLDAKLATLEARFEQRVLKEREASTVWFSKKEDLAGLDASELKAAAQAAEAAGRKGQYGLELANTTGQPVLAELRVRASREKVLAASLARGSHGGEFDTRADVAEIARLRAQRAELLGFASHAAYQVADETVASTDRLDAFLKRLVAPSVARAKRDAAELQARIDADHGGFTLEAADWPFYAQKLRASRFAYDESTLRPYFPMDRVLRDGVLYAATRLYGLQFKERHDLPVYDPDVLVFDVIDRDGKPLAIFMADLYARAGKNGGAWESEYVTPNALRGDHGVVAIHLNVPKPPKGQPTLMTVDDVSGMFHEFGHALHAMLSGGRYPRLSGTAVPPDFAEYPSMFNEMWAMWPEVLTHYARHWKTGAPIPEKLVAKVQASATFDQGYAWTEMLGATLLDQAWHHVGSANAPKADDVLAFEADALHRAGTDLPQVPSRYRSTYFSHAFAIDYSGLYYAYLYSEAMAADTQAWIREHGGLTRENGDRYRDAVLGRGGSREGLAMFKDMTGHEPSAEALLAKHGLN